MRTIPHFIEQSLPETREAYVQSAASQKCLYYRYLSRFMNHRDDQQGTSIVTTLKPRTSNVLRINGADELRVYSMSEGIPDALMGS